MSTNPKKRKDLVIGSDCDSFLNVFLGYSLVGVAYDYTGTIRKDYEKVASEFCYVRMEENLQLKINLCYLYCCSAIDIGIRNLFVSLCFHCNTINDHLMSVYGYYIKYIKYYDYFKDKKIVLFALPGAFTPTCSKHHCPSFVNCGQLLKEKGVHEVVCTSVNDAWVMDAWGEMQNAKGIISMLGDGNGEWARGVGLTLDLQSKGLGIRSKRYAMIIENLKVTHIGVDESGYKNSSCESILPLL